MTSTGLVNANAVKIPLRDKSVHMACCSPPYWGLRSYGLEEWLGGDPKCGHIKSIRATSTSTLKNDGRPNPGAKNYEEQTPQYYVGTCGKCGAVSEDAGIGLESTPEEFITNMVEVGREVWRVLRDDGTWWVNLGDSYASRTSGTGARGGSFASERSQWQGNPVRTSIPFGLKPKDLVGIPWRVALALQADGWYLRSDIIWAKPNPMPESVTDRPTKAHEYVFLLTKRARYFYDADAVREAAQPSSYERDKYPDGNRKITAADYLVKELTGNMKPGMRVATHPAGRNRRTVWTIATQPYSGAHFATWPEALVEPMVKAGTSEWGCCPECGSQWERVVEKVGERATHGINKVANAARGRHGTNSIYNTGVVSVTKTLGFRPACDHDLPPIPCTGLDPFAGSGTTGVVARRLGRHFVGIDLSFDYLHDQARARLALDALDAWNTGQGAKVVDAPKPAGALL